MSTAIMLTVDAVAGQISTGAASTENELPNSGQRWTWALLAGIAVSVPFGVLLSYLSSLPFLWGIFYFALGGIILGAVVFRFARSLRPIRKTRARWGTGLIVGTCWLTALFVEAEWFPTTVSEWILDTMTTLPEGISREQFQKERREAVARSLTEQAWPGGMIGYLRWSATSGRLEVPVTKDISRVYRAAQSRNWWLARVVLSIVTLTFGVYSQLLTLTKLPKPREKPPGGGVAAEV